MRTPLSGSSLPAQVRQLLDRLACTGSCGPLVVESLFFLLLFHDLRRCGLLASCTHRATCAGTVQRCSAFVEVKRGCGYHMGLKPPQKLLRIEESAHVERR